MEIKEKIVPNWGQVFKSYSFIFHVLAALLTVVEIILPHMFLIQSSMTPKTYGIVMFVLNVAGGLGRFIKQNKVPSDVPVA